MRFKVGIDIDGVLSDFILGFTQLTREVCPEWTGFPYPTSQQRCWGFEDPENEHGYTSEIVAKVWSAVEASPDFWENLCTMPGSSLDHVRDFSGDVDTYALTSRSAGPHILAQTARWLRSHGLHNVSPIVCPHKGEVCHVLGITHFLDDCPANIVNVSAKSAARVFVRRQQYNEGVFMFSPSVYVDSVSEFLDHIEDELWKEEGDL